MKWVITSSRMWEYTQCNLNVNKQGSTTCQWLACQYNLNGLISPLNANQPWGFSVCSFHFFYFFPSCSSDHCFPSELYQQRTAFQPISEGKHNNNQSFGLMHSTSSAVNPNWFFKVLSFRGALLALVFVKKRGPRFEMAGHSKIKMCFEGETKTDVSITMADGTWQRQTTVNWPFHQSSRLCFIVYQGQVVSRAAGAFRCYWLIFKEGGWNLLLAEAEQ